MLERLRRWRPSIKLWRLVGYDAFAGDWYPLAGAYPTEAWARLAARFQLWSVERAQPSSVSGGQGPGGIQDRVYIVRPDGSRYRYLPGRTPGAVEDA